MKKYFITGLIIVLPLAVTLAIVSFIFNLLTEPLAGVVVQLFDHFSILETSHQLQFFVSQLLILIFFVVITVAVGMITRYFFVKSLINFWDYLMHKIPLIRSIYKTSQDVINTLFASNENAFQQVVLVPFPSTGSYSIGFMTQKNITDFTQKNEGAKVAVFIPASPSPTSGFLIMYKEEEVIFLDMTVEDAFKYVISCGVINTPLNVVSPNFEAKDA